jgi:hypothetical protein
MTEFAATVIATIAVLLIEKLIERVARSLFAPAG